MELGVLVQGYRICGMLSTEDMATMPAMMTSGDQVEELSALWRITCRGCVVGLHIKSVKLDELR